MTIDFIATFLPLDTKGKLTSCNKIYFKKGTPKAEIETNLQFDRGKSGCKSYEDSVFVSGLINIKVKRHCKKKNVYDFDTDLKLIRKNFKD